MNGLHVLSCPNCDNNLQIAEGIARFACARCGCEYLVRRGGGIVTLVLVTQDTGSAGETSARETTAGLQEEIRAAKDNLWSERKSVRAESVFTFLVMLQDIHHQRHGTKRKRSVLDMFSFSKPEFREEDFRNVLREGLSSSELAQLAQWCDERATKHAPLDYYRAGLERLMRLEEALTQAQRRR